MFGLPRELEESAPPRFANAVGFVPVATMAAYTRGSGWLAWGPGLLVATLLAAVTARASAASSTWTAGDC